MNDMEQLEQAIEETLKRKLSYKQRRDLIMVLLDIKFWRFENANTKEGKSLYMKQYEELELKMEKMAKN